MTHDGDQPGGTWSHVAAAHWAPLLVLGAVATLVTEPLVHRLAPRDEAPPPRCETPTPVAPAAPVALEAPPLAATTAEPAVASSREYLRRGARFAAREQWEKALVAYTWARDTNPRSAPAHLGRALMLLELGRVEAAAHAAARAQALSREPGEALVLQGLVAQLKGRPAEAHARYRAYLAAAPQGEWADELRRIVGAAAFDDEVTPR